MRSNSVIINFNQSISALLRSSLFSEALRLFIRLHGSSHHRPDEYTISAAVSASANHRSAAVGGQLHSYIISRGFISFPHVANSLLSFYSKTSDLTSMFLFFYEIHSPDSYSFTTFLSGCFSMGRLFVARKVFDEMQDRPVSCWNVMISGFYGSGDAESSIHIFSEMCRSPGTAPDSYTFSSLMHLCCSEGLLHLGQQVHSMILRRGHMLSLSAVNAMISMYLSSGEDQAALAVFDQARSGPVDPLTVTTMVRGMGRSGRADQALMFLKEMKKEVTTVLTEVTFSSLLTSSPSLLSGRHLHGHALSSGYHPPSLLLLSNSAIAMYSDHHDLPSADSVFSEIRRPDLVSWNSLLSAHSRGPRPWTAPSVLVRMMARGFRPDEFTLSSISAACEFSAQVESLLALALKHGTLRTTRVSNAFISAFFDTGRAEEAAEVFRVVGRPDVVSFNSVISGFLLHARPAQALAAFAELLAAGVAPDARTLTLVAAAHGREVHAYALRRRSAEVRLWNALVSFYAEAGELGSAWRVFEGMGGRTTVSWNALICGCARHGDGVGAAGLVRAMRLEGVEPDEVTLVALVSAYAHVGMVEEGLRVLFSMTTKYGFGLDQDQLASVVDLLARAGHLGEVETLMAAAVGSAGLWPLLGACVVRTDVRLGRVAAERILEGGGAGGSAAYVQLSNLYAASGEWEMARRVRRAVDGVTVRKPPGCSLTRVGVR